MRWYSWRWWRLAFSIYPGSGITWDLDGEWRPVVGRLWRLWWLWWKNLDRELSIKQP